MAMEDHLAELNTFCRFCKCKLNLPSYIVSHAEVINFNLSYVPILLPSQDDTNLKYLICVFYTEWLIMVILTMMTMVKMTNLDKEVWVWFKIYKGMFFIFSLPSLLVSTRDCHDQYPTRSNYEEDS